MSGRKKGEPNQRPAYFIRRHGDECAIVKLHADGREGILETGLTLTDAETLYFICIGEPVYEGAGAVVIAGTPDPASVERKRPTQLAFKF